MLVACEATSNILLRFNLQGKQWQVQEVPLRLNVAKMNQMLLGPNGKDLLVDGWNSTGDHSICHLDLQTKLMHADGLAMKRDVRCAILWAPIPRGWQQLYAYTDWEYRGTSVMHDYKTACELVMLRHVGADKSAFTWRADALAQQAGGRSETGFCTRLGFNMAYCKSSDVLNLRWAPNGRHLVASCADDSVRVMTFA